MGISMHVLDALQAGHEQGVDDAAIMMAGGEEVGRRISDPLRLVKLWKPDVREGILAFWRFRVRVCSRLASAAVQLAG